MAVAVIYDADCGFCARSKNVIAHLDFFRAMRWIPLQSAEAAGHAIPREELERALYLIRGRRRWAGFSAFKRIFARLLPFWLLAALAVWITPWSVLALLLLFSPLSNPAGNHVYDWIARNRYRIPGSTCQRPF
ncbi:MAG: thiol-disulfide oxidoreductase DCC family protein [Bryobacteraceae bacterium]